MPQLDLYRAIDEITIIIMLIILLYFLFIIGVLPIIIQRAGLKKEQENKREKEHWKEKVIIGKNQIKNKD